MLSIFQASCKRHGIIITGSTDAGDPDPLLIDLCAEAGVQILPQVLVLHICNIERQRTQTDFNSGELEKVPLTNVGSLG